MEVYGSGFPAGACAHLEAAVRQIERAREELAAASAGIAWRAEAAEAFREAAGAQVCEAASIALRAADALALLRWQGIYLAVDGGAR
ncbi:hypothetical protein [Microbacterium sp. NPDC096154]|uniref:hypothetical protein n=1 Tax=Microbacterium sp. NPDC096154 TaxID=3155549 RepID=UPI003323F06B